jgi:hypothetical protein
MSPEELLGLRRRRPFQPFRIHLSDGVTFDVRHPELVMPGLESFVLGFPASEQNPAVYGRYNIVSLLHVVRLEPLPAESPASGNGAS